MIRGTTAKTGMVLVLAVTTPSCPARIPSGANVLVPPNPLWTGGISSDLRVRVDETAKRYCVYLVPAEQDAYGHTSYKATAPPIGTADVLVGAAPRLAGGGAFGSGTSDNTSLQLIVAPNGSTITKILVTCGGNPLRPSALGKAFIGKRFTARVSIPLTSRVRWAGLVLPDNSNNYDAPIPARWNGQVHYSLNATVRTVDGGYPRLTGTGVLSGDSAPLPDGTSLPLSRRSLGNIPEHWRRLPSSRPAKVESFSDNPLWPADRARRMATRGQPAPQYDLTRSFRNSWRALFGSEAGSSLRSTTAWRLPSLLVRL